MEIQQMFFVQQRPTTHNTPLYIDFDVCDLKLV